MENILSTLVDLISRGVQVGLLVGVLVGSITWGLMKSPGALFRSLFGFILGFFGFALFRGQDVAGLWSQIAASAGGAIPEGLATYTINLATSAIIAGMAGMALVLAVGDPAHTVRGALFGGLTGIFLGVVLHVVINITAFPVASIYYAPGIGLLVMVLFAILGAGS
jgi:hypothetical protein